MLFLFYRNGFLYSVLYHICHKVVSCSTGKHYDKYDILENTATIPVEQKQPYDKYDIVQNTGNHSCRTETTLRQI